MRILSAFDLSFPAHATSTTQSRRPAARRQENRHHLPRRRREVPAAVEDQESRTHRDARSARHRSARALRRQSDAAAGLSHGHGEDIRGDHPVRMGHRLVRCRGSAGGGACRGQCRAHRLRAAGEAVPRRNRTDAAAVLGEEGRWRSCLRAGAQGRSGRADSEGDHGL